VVGNILSKEQPRLDKVSDNLQHCLRSLHALQNFSKKLKFFLSMVSGEREGDKSASIPESKAGASADAADSYLQHEISSSQEMSLSPDSSPEEDSASTNDTISPERALDEALARSSICLVPLPNEQSASSPYDHRHCSDCVCVYMMANECAMQLAASQHFASEGTLRLLQLQPLYEQIAASMRQLEESDIA
jgi:hypothetical protein